MDWYLRLTREKEDLDDKRRRLGEFLDSDGSKSLDEMDIALLSLQLQTMETYIRILNMRLEKGRRYD